MSQITEQTIVPAIPVGVLSKDESVDVTTLQQSIIGETSGTKLEHVVSAPDDKPIQWAGLTLEAGTILVKFLAMGPYAYIFMPRILSDHPYLIVKRNGEIVRMMSLARDGQWTFIADQTSKGWNDMVGAIGSSAKSLVMRVRGIGKTLGIIRGGYSFVRSRPIIIICICVVIVIIAAWLLHRYSLLPWEGAQLDISAVDAMLARPAFIAGDEKIRAV